MVFFADHLEAKKKQEQKKCGNVGHILTFPL